MIFALRRRAGASAPLASPDFRRRAEARLAGFAGPEASPQINSEGHY